MEKLSKVQKQIICESINLAEKTDCGLVDFIYLLKIAEHGENIMIIDPGESNIWDSGSTIGVYGKTPTCLWDYVDCEPDDLPNEDKFHPTMMRIHFDVVANEEDTARNHKISTRTLQRWTRQGLPSYKVGRERFFLKKDVEDYAEKMRLKR